MSLSFGFIENSLVAEITEIRKAAFLFLRYLKIVEYVLPVASVARSCLWALLMFMAIDHLGVVIGVVMTLLRSHAGTKFYLSLLFAQLDHVVDNLNANQDLLSRQFRTSRPRGLLTDIMKLQRENILSGILVNLQVYTTNSSATLGVLPSLD